MNIIIRLPKLTGFYMELDGQLIHAKYENTTTNLFLAKGEHTISAIDQAPTPKFLSKLFRFLNPISQSIDDFSNEITFGIKNDLNIAISIMYEKREEVAFVFDEELSELLA